MARTLDANQINKLDRPYLQPIYLVHVTTATTTLYFSDRDFYYNSHNYESYLVDLPALADSINQLGGYLNLQAKLRFVNAPYRGYDTLLEYFDTDSPTYKAVEIFVLYGTTDEDFGGDVSTKLCKATMGEIIDANSDNFSIELFSRLYYLDAKNPFTQINTTNWPNADPRDIGKYENVVYGSLRDIPCHCVQTYAVSTLYLDMAATGESYIYLSDVDYPIAFPNSGCVKIGSEQIDYSAKDSINKRLTIQTRPANGTTAAVHKRGTPCWLIETPVGTPLTFKYLVAGHQMKAGSVVYAGRDRIRINSGDYTLNLNDGGKTTIAFTERQIQKVLEIISSSIMNEGSHTHPNAYTTTLAGTSASYTPVGNGWSDSGDPNNMRDGSLETEKYVYNNGAGPGAASATLQVNFPAWSGPTPAAVYACICHQSNVNNDDGAYVKFYKTGGTLISDLGTTAKTTQKWNIGTSVPTSLYVQIYIGNYPYHSELHHNYEMWLEISTDNTGAGPASGVTTTVTVSGSDPEVIAPLILCDGEGYEDDGGGTYTGTGNLLIENPSDVRRHMLIALLGIDSGDIGTSFTDMRTTYAARAGGYKFGFILSYIGDKPSEIFKRLDEQSRSSMQEDGGLFQLALNDIADPDSSLTITADTLLSDPVFNQTSATRIKNNIRASYDYDWSGLKEGRKFQNNYMKQVEVPHAASIAKYGTLSEDWEFPAISLVAMADDVADWILLQEKDVIKTVRLVCDWSARVLERGDFFILTHTFWSGLKWRVLSIKENPETQSFEIEAIQFIDA